MPAVVAVKFTVIVQLADAATVAPQVLVWLKLLALVPVIVMPLIVNAVPPLLLNVMFCEVTVDDVAVPATKLGKVTEATLMLTEAAAGAAGELLPPHPTIPAIATIPTIAATTPLTNARRTTCAANPGACQRTKAHTCTDDQRLVKEDRLFTVAPKDAVMALRTELHAKGQAVNMRDKNKRDKIATKITERDQIQLFL